jgi:carboxymethylenebutenolidase
MCYDDDARPPIEPNDGAANGEDMVLTAEDGNRFAAYAAHPEQPGKAQVLIFPDVRGLHQFYKELALRFAETGISALAMDYFGRTAGLTARNDSFEYMPHVEQMRVQTFNADVAAALAQLRFGAGATRSTFIVGFCMGGSLALRTAASGFDLAGVIGFYAGLSRVRPADATGTILDIAGSITCPVLGLFGGADQGIPVSDVEALDSKLDTAGVDHEIVIYPGAPHSFFDRRATDYAEASADAWQRMLSFIEKHAAWRAERP